MNTSSVLYLPANAKGDDYIVGDLHGQYDALQTLLAEVRFSKKKDRLFSVGDMINRGPQSAECLDLLKEPWFHAVTGNHDACLRLALQAAFPEELGAVTQNEAEDGREILYFFGGRWALERIDCPAQWKPWVLEMGRLLTALPSVIVVEGGQGTQRFNVVHSFLHDLISKSYLTDETLDSFHGVIPAGRERILIWSKEHDCEYHLSAEYQGLSLTYCGHCVVPEPQRILGHLMIDTGAGKANRINGSKLTLICHRTQQQFQHIFTRPEEAPIQSKSQPDLQDEMEQPLFFTD